MAVGDTETMKKYATIKRLGMQLEYHIEIEEAYPSIITRKVYEMVYVEKPNKSSRVFRCEVSFTALFNNTWKPTFKSPPTVAFFAAVNHK